MKTKKTDTGGRKGKRGAESKSIENLVTRVREFAEPAEKLREFDQLPLSELTLRGLRAAHFIELTDVQRECIVPALQRKDQLVAARTGSGKTLGFLVPLLERLHVEKWNQMDGLGALVITPTRELAFQIFEVLRKIGRYHPFSAGLLIGGKNVKDERERVSRLNILVCTPGRLLQHMDESPGFDAYNLQMLVLDEADRIMDMGFRKTVDAIVANLPPQRQTMLFSATQTKSVGDLARLSLVGPKYISVHEAAASTTPVALEQFWTVVPLAQKLDTLWSFLRSHTKSKILVFLSSSKQVRFVFEAFRRLQPGIPLLHLHGRQKQTARSEVTERFSRSRTSCLIATDVVARGMDFPEVDWVIQVDCPEDVATYIHRVGRSARAGKSGRALLLLTPEEESPFVANLQARRIPIQKLTVREAKKSSIQGDIQGQCFQDPELKYLAQKAFMSYVRSVYVQSDKTVFNVDNIPLDDFAKSLGLASAPQIKIRGSASSSKQHDLKNLPRALREQAEPQDKAKPQRTKYERMFERQNQDVLSEHYRKLHAHDDEDDQDDFLTVKQVHEAEDTYDDEDSIPTAGPPEISPNEAPSKRAAKRALSKKEIVKHSGSNPTKLVFDDQGQPHQLYEFQNEEDFAKAGSAEAQRRAFVEAEAREMAERDAEDKNAVRAKRAEKKRRRKELERLAREGITPTDTMDSEDEDSVADGSDGSEGSELPLGSNTQSDPASESDSEPESQRPRKRAKTQLLEVEEPETLEDLEALSTQLLRR